MKIMLIGPSAAGKTTLIQRLIDEEIKYDKTQAVEYIGNFIDTPGEYMQQRGYWGSLTITSHDADIILLIKRPVCLPVLVLALVGRTLCSFLKEIHIPAV